jgi:two-component system sensor histidine kinase PilS (NtrC family)
VSNGDSDRFSATSELSLQRSTKLSQQLRWMISLRLVVVTSVVLPYLLLQLASPSETISFNFLYLLAGTTYAASLLYIAQLRWLRKYPAVQAYIQFFGDLVLITGMVYYFGGTNSPFSILYFVIIIVASAMLHRRSGLIVATVAWVLYSVTILALYFSWLPETSLSMGTAVIEEGIESLGELAGELEDSRGETIPVWRLVYNLVIHFFGFYLVALLTSHLAQSAIRAERELLEKREDLATLQVVHRDIIESVPSGLITCNLEGRVTSVNRAAQDILGSLEAALVGQHVTKTGLLSDLHWQEQRGSDLASQDRREIEYQRGDSLRHIGFSLTELVTTKGERSGYIIIFQDLTEWRKLQEEVRLKDRLAAVGQLASGIAHEVGNPLAAISGSVQMLSASLDGEESEKKLLDIILKESQRLDRTVKSFLQFARPKERSNVRFDIAKLLSENLDLLRNSPEVSQGHHLTLDLDPSSVSLIADPDQVSQIFWNLARNALRAMPDGGTLHIKGMLRDTDYLVRFTDTGRGMAEKERENLFHPFHSFFDGGSGIGMAIVYRIVEEHGGKLAVESTEGEGTSITVALPVAPSTMPLYPVEI